MSTTIQNFRINSEKWEVNQLARKVNTNLFSKRDAWNSRRRYT